MRNGYPVPTPAASRRPGRAVPGKAAFRILARGLDAIAIVGVVLALAAAFVVVADIVLRKSGERGVLGQFDLVLLSVTCVANLSIPAGFIRMAHIRLEGPLELLGPRVRAAADLVAALLGLAVFVLIGRYGYAEMKMNVASGAVAQTMGFSVAWYWAPLLVGALLTILASLGLVHRFAVILLTGEDIAAEGEGA